jgi:RNA polymerase sigma-70 factor (ECF subfamily)
VDEDGRSDRDLLAAYARQDESAFVVFFHRHRRAVAGRLGQRLPLDDDVEEALQEVFLRAATKWRQVRYVDDSARGWLLGVARNVLSERERSASRRPKETQLPRGTPTMRASADESDFDRLVEVQMMEAIVARMNPTDQEVYRLGFVLGHTDVAIADMLKMKASAVRKRSERIREQLRKVRGEDAP